MAYSLETSSVKTIVQGAEVSGFCDVVARQKITALSGEVPQLSAGEGIDISTVDGKTVITNNISAGENISLVYDMETNTYRIDSTDTSADMYELSAGNGIGLVEDAINKITRIDVTGIDLSDYYQKTETSSKQELSDAFDYVSANAGHTYTGVAPIQVNNETNQISITGESLSAGPGIDMFSSGGYVVISANGGGGGGTYTGISPIVVNNNTNQISAKGVPFGVQSPLFFVQDDNEAVIIGCSAGGVTPELISTGYRALLPSDVSYSMSSQLVDGVVRDTQIFRNPMGGMTYGGTTTSVTNYNSNGLDFSSHYLGNDSVEIDDSFSIGWKNCKNVIDSVETSASAWNDTREVVQANSASWGQGGTAYTGDAQGALDEVYANSGVWLTSHQDLSDYYTTADADTLSSMLSGAIDYVSANAGTGGGDYVPLTATNCTIGSNNTSETYSFAQGGNNKAKNEGLAQGYNCSAENYSFAQGVGNSAAYYSIAQGSNNRASYTAMAQGDACSAYSKSLALGYRASAGYNSLCIGDYASAHTQSFNIGGYNYIESTSFSVGNSNTAKWGSVALGYGNHSAIATSFCFGYANTGNNLAAVFGKNLILNGHYNSGTMALGTYNKLSADVAFVIGNGTSNSRSDCFAIYPDGSVSAAGKISANGVELGNVPYNMVYTASLPDNPDANTLYLIPEA